MAVEQKQAEAVDVHVRARTVKVLVCGRGGRSVNGQHSYGSQQDCGTAPDKGARDIECQYAFLLIIDLVYSNSPINPQKLQLQSLYSYIILMRFGFLNNLNINLLMNNHRVTVNGYGLI